MNEYLKLFALCSIVGSLMSISNAISRAANALENISATHHAGCPACVGKQDPKKEVQIVRGKVVDQPNAGVRVIQTKAPDGVNTITTEIDADGFVREQSSTCVHVLRKYEPEAK